MPAKAARDSAPWRTSRRPKLMKIHAASDGPTKMRSPTKNGVWRPAVSDRRHWASSARMERPTISIANKYAKEVIKGNKVPEGNTRFVAEITWGAVPEVKHCLHRPNDHLHQRG